MKLAANTSRPTDAAGAGCPIHESKAFGAACIAAVSATLAEGSSQSFPNYRPGYRGSITANCSGGRLVWETPSCNRIAAAPPSTAPLTTVTEQAGKAKSLYKIGTYYFPGWKSGQAGNARSEPWDAIELYEDHIPLLGRYAEDSPGVMDQQLAWMREYGLAYVVFNWMWGRDGRPYLAHGVDAYLAAQSRHGVEFAIQWSNHTDYNFTREQLVALFRFWARNYLGRPDYLKLDGKPLVFLFSASVFNRNAAALGMTAAELMALGDATAKAEGLAGLSFIGGMWADKGFDYSRTSGYRGFSAYNLHSPADIALTPRRAGNVSHDYAELNFSYRNYWQWMQRNASGLFIVPMSSGWDKRPWGGSADPLHDDSRSVPQEFAAHLAAARQFMDEQPERTRRMGVICCWNEFGEGSFIEPTKVDGFAYLEQVRKVFGSN